MISRVFRYNVIRRSISTKVPKIKDPKLKHPKKFHEIPYHEQYESRDNENVIKRRFAKPNSYGEWINNNPGVTRRERQHKIKELLDKFYSTEIKTN